MESYFIEKNLANIEFTESCWDWLGVTTPEGYGKGYNKPSVGVYERPTAHRLIYELLKAPIPDGLVCDHLCRNRGCVNPDHIDLVTSGENVLRGEGVAPTNARKTHCKRGHEYTPENIYRSKSEPNSRHCYKCKLTMYNKPYGKAALAQKAKQNT